MFAGAGQQEPAGTSGINKLPLLVGLTGEREMGSVAVQCILPVYSVYRQDEQQALICYK